MNTVVLKCEALAKKYKISRKNLGRYSTLRDSISEKIAQLFKRARVGRVLDHFGDDEFWALRDVSFEICKGDVLGIIGRNGAGKSTLLKIFSRITPPSRGRVEVFGRVVSLLEVGTGFHPELTGRENIYMNAAILGMKRKEVEKAFDQIVEFAEVEEFLDVPVKRYSSGMYVKLAFSVASHLNPEILILDEVLAVGDVQFQNKCLEKIKDVARSGNTIVFVSHNMASIQQFCNKCVLLDKGRIQYFGDVTVAIKMYLQGLSGLVSTDLKDRHDRQGSQLLKIANVEILDVNGEPVSTVLTGSDIMVRFYYNSIFNHVDKKVNIAFNVINSKNIIMTHLNSIDVGQQEMVLYNNGFFECRWTRLSLRSDIYRCTIFCQVDGEIVDWVQSAFMLNVEDGDYYNTGVLVSRDQCEVLVDYRWLSSQCA